MKTPGANTISILIAAFTAPGRVCSSQAQEFINQEEDLETVQDNHSLDISSQGGWIKHVVRRNTQVAPDSKSDLCLSATIHLGNPCLTCVRLLLSTEVTPV